MRKITNAEAVMDRKKFMVDNWRLLIAGNKVKDLQFVVLRGESRKPNPALFG